MNFEVFPKDFSIAIFSMPENYVERIEKEMKEGHPAHSSLEAYKLFAGKAVVFEEWQYEGESQRVVVRIRRAGMVPLEFLGTLDKEGVLLDTVRKNDLLYGKKDELWYG